MSDEIQTKSLLEQMQNLQQQNLIEGRAEIDEVLKRRGLMLIGMPRYVQAAPGWLTVIDVGVIAASGGQA